MGYNPGQEALLPGQTSAYGDNPELKARKEKYIAEIKADKQKLESIRPDVPLMYSTQVTNLIKQASIAIDSIQRAVGTGDVEQAYRAFKSEFNTVYGMVTGDAKLPGEPEKDEVGKSVLTTTDKTLTGVDSDPGGGIITIEKLPVEEAKSSLKWIALGVLAYFLLK